jgi:hypothetical protein
MGSLLYRAMGAAVLDAGTYESVENDRAATAQAVLIVVLAAMAGGIGLANGNGIDVRLVAAWMAVALVVWVGWAGLILQIGGDQFRRPETHVDLGELLRTTGFAATPGLLQILAIVEPLATPIFVVSWVWMWAAMVVAIRHSLDIQSFGRAIAICGAALGLVLAMAVLLSQFFDRVVV